MVKIDLTDSAANDVWEILGVFQPKCMPLLKHSFKCIKVWNHISCCIIIIIFTPKLLKGWQVNDVTPPGRRCRILKWIPYVCLLGPLGVLGIAQYLYIYIYKYFRFCTPFIYLCMIDIVSFSQIQKCLHDDIVVVKLPLQTNKGILNQRWD